ncbi:MAG: UvrD-helicase domain-containing protein [Bacteroidota bacterium]|nr:UvrD-helicase domain-containing protein [Bacteroidota bacterium]
MSFVIYKSSAGSGKTFTLVKEYLKIVLENPGKFRYILAVTFTNKAANEMKDRVMKTLQALAEGDSVRGSKEDIMLNVLTNETGLDKDLISVRASKVLELILHNYSEFAISTIDSFMYKVIRTFAHDLKIPMNFDVELDETQFIAQAIDVLISHVGHDKDLTNVMVRFIESKTDMESSWKIERDLQDFAKIMIRDESFPYLMKLRYLEIKNLVRIDAKMLSGIKSFEKEISSLAIRSMELINKPGLTKDSFERKGSGIYNYLLRISNKDYTHLQPGTYAAQTAVKENWAHKEATRSEQLGLSAIQQDLISIYNAMQQLIEDHYNDYILFQRLRKHIYPIAVLNEIEKIIDEFRENDNILHISEFNRRISKIVSTEPIPFIYERLGERYQHFLVDEFQDTSILQWHNLIPLFENSLGYGQFNMVVGDGKQAIYRWRGGEVEQFNNLPEIIGAKKDKILLQRESVLKNSAKRKNLHKNYRSGSKIIQFNNDFYNCIREVLPEDKQGAYEEVTQEWDPEKTGGFISFEFLNGQDKKDYNDSTLTLVRELIDKILLDRYCLKDIAILCRSNKEASMIARFLLIEGYAVISSESLLLSASAKVNFLIACLRFISNSKDRIALCEMIKYLIDSGHLPGAELHYSLVDILNPERNDTSGAVVSQEKMFTDFLERHHIHFSISYFLNQSPFELLEELIRLFDLKSKFDPYLQFFLDAVLEYTARFPGGAMDFLDWWDENHHKLSIVVSSGQDAVQIMTIHKAKGLEFPVVIYPFADDDFNRAQKKNIWVDIDHDDFPELKSALLSMSSQLRDTSFEDVYDEEMAQTFMDAINLLYVVMTRPTDRFYAISKLPVLKKIGEIKNIAQLFGYYLHTTGVWEEDKKIYTFGEESKKAEQENNNLPDVFTFKRLISESWKERLLISTLAPDSWDLESPDKSREWGNLVHYLLSKVEYAKSSEDVIEEARAQGLIDRAGAEKISFWFDKMMNHPELSEFFSKQWQVRNEAEIFWKGEASRPDRLVFQGKKCVIMDYKTGKEDPKHHRQLKWYARILDEMGYDVIGRYLVYLGDQLKLVVV